MNYEEKKVFLINIAVLAVSVLLIVIVSKILIGYLLPFVIGTILAFAVQNPAQKLSARIKVRSGILAAVFVAVIYLLGAWLMILLFWKLMLNAQNYLAGISKIFGDIQPTVDRLAERFSRLTSRMPAGYAATVKDAVSDTFQTLVQRLTNFVSASVTKIAGTIPAAVFSTIVTVAASCYIAKDFEALKSFLKGFLKKETVTKIVCIRDIFTNDIFKFIGGYLILAAITFAELAAGLLLIRVPHAFLIALLIDAVDILPVLGSGTVLVPWGIICLLSGGIGRGIGLLVLYAVITVVRYFIEPKVVGRQLGIRPLFMLIVMFVGLKIGGLGGLLLFPLLFVVVIDYYKIQMREEEETGTSL